MSDTREWERRQLAVRVQVKLDAAINKLKEVKQLLYEAHHETREDQGAVVNEWAAVHELHRQLTQVFSNVDAEVRVLTDLATRLRGDGG